MSFENLMGAVMRWTTEMEAASAVGAELTLMQSGEEAPPEIREALHGVSVAAGLDGLADLTPQQRAIIIGVIRTYVHQARDLLDEPARAAGWTFSDPVILDGWGRGSGMVPALIARLLPELGEVRSFLDVGTGVGLLAVSAATLWPTAAIVGIDTWEPSLERARIHVGGAGLRERITLRAQNLAQLDDVDAYDLAWVPSFFITEDVLTASLPRLLRAARPGGWIVLGRFLAPPDPVAAATGVMRTIRQGGCILDAARAERLLESAGAADVRSMLPPPGSVPLELTVGRRPAS